MFSRGLKFFISRLYCFGALKELPWLWVPGTRMYQWCLFAVNNHNKWWQQKIITKKLVTALSYFRLQGVISSMRLSSSVYKITNSNCSVLVRWKEKVIEISRPSLGKYNPCISTRHFQLLKLLLNIFTVLVQ